MTAPVVAAVTARKTTFLAARTATFTLSEDGLVTRQGPGGAAFSLTDGDRMVRNFRRTPPGTCLEALAAAVTARGWTVIPAPAGDWDRPEVPS